MCDLAIFAGYSICPRHGLCSAESTKPHSNISPHGYMYSNQIPNCVRIRGYQRAPYSNRSSTHSPPLTPYTVCLRDVCTDGIFLYVVTR